MAKSIRISDQLYDMAASSAVLMHRSLAQQIEHWAALGQALEARGDSAAVLSAKIAHMHEVDRMKVATGQMKSTALYAIAPAKAKRMKVTFSRDAMEAFELER